MAPEVNGITVDSEPSAEKTFSLAVDIWSVGTITIEILTGQQAFPTLGELFIYTKGAPTAMAASRSPECRDFLQQTMAVSPHRRLTSQQALKHSWIGSQQQPDLLFPGRYGTSQLLYFVWLPMLDNRLLVIKVRTTGKPERKLFARSPQHPGNGPSLVEIKLFHLFESDNPLLRRRVIIKLKT